MISPQSILLPLFLPARLSPADPPGLDRERRRLPLRDRIRGGASVGRPVERPVDAGGGKDAKTSRAEADAKTDSSDGLE